MNEKLKKILVFIGGFIASISSALLFNRFKRRNGNNVSNNGIGADTTGTKQPNDDRTNGKIEARIDTIESITRANKNIFDKIRKRKENT